MGSEHNQPRLSLRIRESPSIHKNQKDKSSKFVTFTRVVKRGRRFVTETMYRARPCRIRSRGLLLNVLRSSKTVGRSETHFEPKTIESHVKQKIIQNGNSPIGDKGGTARGMAGVLRPPGCVHACTNLEGRQKIFTIQNSGPSIPIQGSAVRSDGSAKSVHKSSGSIDAGRPVRRNSCFSVLGRPVSKSSEPGKPSCDDVTVGENPHSGGFHHKCRKIPYRSYARPGICRGQVSDKSERDPTSSRKTRESVRLPQSLCSRGVGPGKTIPEVARADGSNDPGCPVLSSVHAPDSNVPPCEMERSVQRLRLRNPSKPASVRPSRVVEVRRQSVSGGPFEQARPHSSSHNRRINVTRLGGSCERYGGSRQMGAQYEQGPHKQFRVGGSIQNMSTFSGNAEGSDSSGEMRQLHSSVVYQQGGGDEVALPVHADLESPSMGPQSGHYIGSNSCPGEVQCIGRHSQQAFCQCTGVAAKSVSGGTHFQCVGQAHDRPVCNRVQSAVADVLLSASRTSVVPCGRPPDGLDRDLWIRVPSNLLDSSGVRENREVQVYNYPDRPQVAPSGVVSQDGGSVSRPPVNPPGQIRPSDPTERQTAPSSAGSARFGGLEVERRRLVSEGFSEEVVSTMQSSVRSASARQYDKLWGIYSNWCQGKGLDPSSAPLREILAFLQSLLNKGLAFRSIGVYRSAISYFHDPIEGLSVGQHPKISKFMKGVFNKNPPVKSLCPSWDLNIVLKFLQDPIFSLERASLQALSMKTAFLVAITSARRVSEIQALSRDSPYTRIEKGGIRLRTVPKFLSKTAVPTHLGQEIYLPAVGKLDELCVRRCVKRYIRATSVIMANDNDDNQPRPLFVCYGAKNKGKKVSKQTIARWLVNTIKAAYASVGKTLPGRVRAHSTRAMSTTTALYQKVPLEEIMRAADWRHRSTFSRHYGLDLWKSQEGAVGRAALSLKQ